MIESAGGTRRVRSKAFKFRCRAESGNQPLIQRPRRRALNAVFATNHLGLPDGCRSAVIGERSMQRAARSMPASLACRLITAGSSRSPSRTKCAAKRSLCNWGKPPGCCLRAHSAAAKAGRVSGRHRGQCSGNPASLASRSSIAYIGPVRGLTGIPPGRCRGEPETATTRLEARVGRGLLFCAARHSRRDKGSHTNTDRSRIVHGSPLVDLTRLKQSVNVYRLHSSEPEVFGVVCVANGRRKRQSSFAQINPR